MGSLGAYWTIQRTSDAVNAADVTRICNIMTEDHLFVDSDGTETRGRERMRQSWVQYLLMMPDYQIQVRESFCKAETVVLTGAAIGTYAPDGTLAARNRWSVPAAWRAVVRDERVAEWQVFVNPEPIRHVMRGRDEGGSDP